MLDYDSVRREYESLQTQFYNLLWNKHLVSCLPIAKRLNLLSLERSVQAERQARMDSETMRDWNNRARQAICDASRSVV